VTAYSQETCPVHMKDFVMKNKDQSTDDCVTQGLAGTGSQDPGARYHTYAGSIFLSLWFAISTYYKWCL